MEDSDNGNRELPPSSTTDQQKQGGGWITFPFILATMAGITQSNGGWVNNLIVYLISVYKVKNIDAAQISNLVNGCGNLVPVLAAIVADSFLGCFSVIWISCFISLIGTILLFITTMIRPSSSESKFQFVLLYFGIALATLGAGGTRSTLTTMGADQFNTQGHQSIYFNWLYFAISISTIMSATLVVYVEDNVSWSWAYGFCVGANALGLVIFLLGVKFYRRIKPQGSPFMGIARVVVASFRKRKALLSMEMEDYYYGADTMKVSSPTKSFRFLNRAALTTSSDTNADGSIAKPWKLCTLQQVEDLKTLLKIMPLWSTSIFLATPIGIQFGLSILQALTMDRNLGPHFKIPAGSILVFCYISTTIFLIIFDGLVLPTCHYIIGRPLTPLQRIGIGHVLNVASMAISAIVESKRLGIAHSKHHEKSTLSISVLWLVPQLAIAGIGEAFYIPSLVNLYYREFPKSLKTLATAMISLMIAISYYLSTTLIDLVRRVTNWLPDDLNDGRLDNVYWSLVVIGVLNFGYFLICAWFYQYQNAEIDSDDDSRSTK